MFLRSEGNKELLHSKIKVQCNPLQSKKIIYTLLFKNKIVVFRNVFILIYVAYYQYNIESEKPLLSIPEEYSKDSSNIDSTGFWRYFKTD